MYCFSFQTLHLLSLVLGSNMYFASSLLKCAICTEVCEKDLA